jgi:hypothetical protein
MTTRLLAHRTPEAPESGSHSSSTSRMLVGRHVVAFGLLGLGGCSSGGGCRKVFNPRSKARVGAPGAASARLRR